MKRSFLPLTIVLATALILSSVSCRATEDPATIHPFILFGVDGADWEVVEWMWEQDRLPHLKRLADRGVAAPLETFHHASPVIWTSVATGVMPDVHGITEFVVPTIKGDQPVSSTLRRVPALWNMVTATGGRVAVLGWWHRGRLKRSTAPSSPTARCTRSRTGCGHPDTSRPSMRHSRGSARRKRMSNRNQCSKRIAFSAAWRSI